MIRELAVVFGLTLMVALTVFAATPPKKIEKKESTEKVYKIFNEGNALFLDARPFPQFKAGHIPGAINLPIHGEKGMELLFQLEDMLQSAPKLVVYCTGIGCDLSELLAKRLLELGIPKAKIIVFKGGMGAWKKAGYPVSKDIGFQKSLQP
ncbi:MAG: rhodanese-like domain-containing protein [Acidobacteria bacterium]|nr:rhodanese-like domain-containing protein [Acidobacteriota bacterium]